MTTNSSSKILIFYRVVFVFKHKNHKVPDVDEGLILWKNEIDPF